MTVTIHDRALETASRFKRSEIDLITIIQEIDEKKAFYEKKCTSTYDYCSHIRLRHNARFSSAFPASRDYKSLGR